MNVECLDNNPGIVEYIDQTVKTTIPNQNEDEELYNLVCKLQMHVHTSYCMPSNRPPGRFGFPKCECKETHLLNLVQSLKNKGNSMKQKELKNQFS